MRRDLEPKAYLSIKPFEGSISRTVRAYTGEEKELPFFIRDVLNEFGLDKVYIDEIGDIVGFVNGRSFSSPSPFGGSHGPCFAQKPHIVEMPTLLSRDFTVILIIQREFT